jgi:hypothetical protein
MARRVAASILSADMLGAFLVARLLLSPLTHNALIMAMRRLGFRPWHAFLAAMFAALVLHTFQIIFPGHCDHLVLLQDGTLLLS